MIKWYALCAKYHDDQINVDEMGGTIVHEKNRTAYRVLVENLKARIHFEDLSIDGSIILEHQEEAE